MITRGLRVLRSKRRYGRNKCRCLPLRVPDERHGVPHSGSYRFGPKTKSLVVSEAGNEVIGGPT